MLRLMFEISYVQTLYIQCMGSDNDLFCNYSKDMRNRLNCDKVAPTQNQMLLHVDMQCFHIFDHHISNMFPLKNVMTSERTKKS